jgi:hypothetical protein
VPVSGIVPGETRSLPNAFTVTANYNRSGNYTVIGRANANYFALDGLSSNIVPSSALTWTTAEITEPQGFSTADGTLITGTGPTTSDPIHSRSVNLEFKCPPNALAGAYSLTIYYVIG